MDGRSLEDFVPSIESKIKVIQDGGGKSIKSIPELEAAHGEAKRLLSNYESAIEEARRLKHLLGVGDSTILLHEGNHRRLLGLLHRCILTARAELQQSVNSHLLDRAQLLQRRNAPPAHKPPTNTPTDSLAQDISDNLREMASSMQDELLRTETSYTLLQASSKRMAATGEQYQALGGVLGMSARLIRGLWRRERSDRWMIMMALGLYCIVLLYIASRRFWLASFVLPWVRSILGGLWRLSIYIGGATWGLVSKRGRISNSNGTDPLPRSHILSGSIGEGPVIKALTTDQSLFESTVTSVQTSEPTGIADSLAGDPSSLPSSLATSSTTTEEQVSDISELTLTPTTTMTEAAEPSRVLQEEL